MRDNNGESVKRRGGGDDALELVSGALPMKKRPQYCGGNRNSEKKKICKKESQKGRHS